MVYKKMILCNNYHSKYLLTITLNILTFCMRVSVSIHSFFLERLYVQFQRFLHFGIAYRHDESL